MRHQHVVSILAGLLCGLVLLAGCGGASTGAEVSGTVTIDGKPLEDGAIFFIPEPGTEGFQSSATITNGKYHLGGEFGLAPGSYQIRIDGYREAKNAPKLLGSGPDALDVPPETPGIPTKEQYLPKKFNTHTTLEKLVVEQGQSSIEKNYDLKQ